VDVVLTDLKMPEMDGITLLEEIKAHDKRAVVIVLTGHPSVDSAVKAIKEGAFDYLVKPIDLEELRVKIDRSLERRRLLQTLAFVRGLNWALIIMIPFWLLLGILLARVLK
jgi:DNA-binding NtrC family response regulator